MLMRQEKRRYLAMRAVLVLLAFLGASFSMVSQVHAEDLTLKLARVLSYQKKYEQSIARYQEYLKSHPRDARAHLELGDVYFWNQRYDEALKEYDAASQDPKLEAMVRQKRGELAIAMGRFEESSQNLKGAVEADPKNANLRLSYARSLSYQKQYDDAIREYERLLEQEPGNLAALSERADVLSWAQRYDEADAAYRKRLGARYDAQPARQLARVLGWAKRYRQALAAYDEAYAQTQDQGIALERAAKAAYWDKHILTALKRYGALLDREPENQEGRFDRAQTEAYEGVYRKAAADFQKIVDADPQHFRASESLEKVQLQWHRRTLEPYGFWFRARSPDRSTHIDRFTVGANFRQPMGEHAALRAGYAFDDFYFGDTHSRLRQQGLVGFELAAAPYVWLRADYLPTAYTRDDRFSQLWNGVVSFRPCDPLLVSVFTLRDDLFNGRAVFEQELRTTAVGAKLKADINRRWTAFADYRHDRINDGNREQAFGVENLVFLMYEPQRLTADLRFDWQNWKQNVAAYFSPQNFWTITLTVHWRHYLNAQGLYYGARNTYYGVKYRFSADRGKSYSNGALFEFYHDISQRFSLGVEAFGDYSTVYNDSGATLRAVGRF